MEQLEKRFYNLDELSKITGIKRNSKNLKRDIINVLKKRGYRLEWHKRRGATITYIPTTPEELLQEILVQKYHVDIQVDLFAFSCFVYALDKIEGFDSMPWEERETYYFKLFGISVDDRTLRNWCAKLLSQKCMMKSTKASFWKTEIINGKKIRSQLSGNEDEYKKYNKRRTELLNEFASEEIEYEKTVNNIELSYDEAIKRAWKSVYPSLWSEFHCCYYYCKSFYFAPWDNEQVVVTDILELAEEILRKEGKLYGNLCIESL